MALAMSAETEQQPPFMQSAPVPSSPPASASAAPAATLGAAAAPTHSNPEKPEAVHLSSAGAEEAKPSEKVCILANLCTRVHSWLLNSACKREIPQGTAMQRDG